MWMPAIKQVLFVQAPVAEDWTLTCQDGRRTADRLWWWCRWAYHCPFGQWCLSFWGAASGELPRTKHLRVVAG